jgi:hypothetical protein
MDGNKFSFKCIFGPQDDEQNPRVRRALHSSETSRSSDLYFVTNVLGQPAGRAVLVSLTFEDGTDRLSRNKVTNYQPTLRNIPEERIPTTQPEITQQLLFLRVPYAKQHTRKCVRHLRFQNTSVLLPPYKE